MTLVKAAELARLHQTIMRRYSSHYKDAMGIINKNHQGVFENHVEVCRRRLRESRSMRAAASAIAAEKFRTTGPEVV